MVTDKGRPPLFIDQPCSVCNKDSTYTDKNGYEYWHINRKENTRMCHRCYQVSDVFKQNRKPWTKRSQVKRITFKNERIYIPFVPRTGICSECKRKTKTHIHHDQYDETDFLNYTRELCISCHTKETWKNIKNKSYNGDVV